MTVWGWILIGMSAWLCASLGAGVLVGRVAALATLDSTLLTWHYPELVSDASWLRPGSAG